MFILKTKKEINETKDPIKDGIHFYNYYTLPTLAGYVTQFYLILCTLKINPPKLNNGHL